jgi:hypothetical protein
MLSLDEVEYERPYPMTEVDERTEACCSRCGLNSRPKPAAEITVIRHRHAGHKNGQWMCYCREHVPDMEWVEGGSRERVRGIGPTCPRCWVTVPAASRWCDNCDRSIDD